MHPKTGLNEFYGTDAVLRAYHARFLPFLDPIPRELPILDLGCGSGVFLELLREHGFKGRGVERAGEAVEQCRRKGLDVVQDDARHFLELQTGASFSATYCAHLVEHFEYDAACELLALAARALTERGRLIVITPNPVSLEVMSEIFWLDPTHVRPYPLPLLENMLRRAGFDIIASGHDDPTGLPRRTLPRRLWLRLVLGKYFGGMNTFVVGVRRIAPQG